MCAKSADATLVTAVFELTPNDPLGGRGFPVSHYLRSLASIAALGVPIVVYTQQRHVAEIARFLEDQGAAAQVIAARLDEVPRFWQIQEVRIHARVPAMPYRDRCHALCFGKFAWLAEQAARNPFDTSRFHWIDAGLAHEGLFPSAHLPRGGGRCGLFTPSLAAALLREERFVLFGLQPVQGSQIHSIHLAELARIVGPDGAPIRTHVIGGLFGGARHDVLRLYEEYDSVLGDLLDRRLLGTEENVLTVLYHRGPSRFALLPFTTWYHEDTDFTQPGPGDTPFYRVVERLASGA